MRVEHAKDKGCYSFQSGNISVPPRARLQYFQKYFEISLFKYL